MLRIRVGRTPSTGRTSTRQRGFALLVVLWTLALIALVGIMIGASGRTEARVARNLVVAAEAEAAVDGAMEEAAFRLLAATPIKWPADGTPKRLTIGRFQVDVRVEDEAGKINPNEVSPEVLRALFAALGLAQNDAVTLTQGIVDWRGGAGAQEANLAAARYVAAGLPYRPPQASFQTVDEVALVAGITPDIARRLIPYLTIAHHGTPDLSKASPVVRRALATLPPGVAGDPLEGEAPVYTIDAETVGPPSVSRRMIVRLLCGVGAPTCLRVIDWSAY
jgi:general secretion pathway protein K